MSKEQVLPIAIILGGLTGLLFLSRRKEEAIQAAVGIQILDFGGNIIPHSSPVILEEGQSYVALVRVTNTSTRAGAAVAVALGGAIYGYIGFFDPIGGVYLKTEIISAPLGGQFQPAEIKEWSIAFAIPPLSGGADGVIAVSITDPDGKEIATAHESLVIALSITYGATADLTI